MTQMTAPTKSEPARAKDAEKRALKILAKSVYRELKTSGYERTDMVAFTNELLDLVTSDFRDSKPTIS